ncbi:PepSY domain-containing protein [Ornithinibacillus xuwenensis]|uniref:PepSY domain-containing protein n=1 Tax=Ornithinibacillus xuwenensis TaxID=3144668 RepID=A0ABU9XGU5_9BACI
MKQLVRIGVIVVGALATILVVIASSYKHIKPVNEMYLSAFGMKDPIVFEEKLDGMMLEIKSGKRQVEYGNYFDAYNEEVLHIQKKHEVDDMEDTEMKPLAISNLIPELQAIEIAESVVEGSVLEMQLNKADSQYVYELELETTAGNVAVEVNAITGEVLKKAMAMEESIHASDIRSYSELKKVMELINEEAYQMEVVEDSTGKRVLIFKNADGIEKYKSVFIKAMNHLKVIEFENGVVFNKIISFHSDRL